MDSNNLCRFCTIDSRAVFNNKNIEVSKGAPASHYGVSPNIDWYNLLKQYYKYYDYYGWPTGTVPAENPTLYDIKYNDMVFIKDTNEIWTQGKFYRMLNTQWHPVLQTLNLITTRYFTFNSNMLYDGEVPIYIALFDNMDAYENFLGMDEVTIKVTIAMDAYIGHISEMVFNVSLSDYRTGDDHNTIKSKQLSVSKAVICDNLTYYMEPRLSGSYIDEMYSYNGILVYYCQELFAADMFITITVSGIGINPVIYYGDEPEIIDKLELYPLKILIRSE